MDRAQSPVAFGRNRPLLLLIHLKPFPQLLRRNAFGSLTCLRKTQTGWERELVDVKEHPELRSFRFANDRPVEDEKGLDERWLRALETHANDLEAAVRAAEPKGAESGVAIDAAVVPKKPTAAGDAEDGGLVESLATVVEFAILPAYGGFSLKGFGEEGWVKDMLGLKYIHRLVAKPGQPIPMQDLGGTVSDERFSADSRSRQPAVDTRWKEDVAESLRELEAQLAKAQKDNDIGATDRAQTDIDALMKQVSASIGIGGRSRDLNNPNDRVRPRIYAAINRAYEALRTANVPMPKMADHFSARISYKSGCFSYDPLDIDITWKTDAT